MDSTAGAGFWGGIVLEPVRTLPLLFLVLLTHRPPASRSVLGAAATHVPDKLWEPLCGRGGLPMDHRGGPSRVLRKSLRRSAVERALIAIQDALQGPIWAYRSFYPASWGMVVRSGGSTYLGFWEPSLDGYFGDFEIFLKAIPEGATWTGWERRMLPRWNRGAGSPTHALGWKSVALRSLGRPFLCRDRRTPLSPWAPVIPPTPSARPAPRSLRPEDPWGGTPGPAPPLRPGPAPPRCNRQ